MRVSGTELLQDHPTFRGNLHCHTTESDGRESPAEVMAAYRRRGYDFLALSDHDVLTVPAREDVPDGLTLIPALEAGAGPHVLCIGTNNSLGKTSDRQAVIDRTRESGGLSVLNHPNWGRSFCHWEHSLMESLDRYTGIEIYNAVVEAQEGSPFATDRWDRLLSMGKRVWGFANDDSHGPEGIGFGWIVVQAERNETEALVSAISKGAFYATSGIHLSELRLVERGVRLVTPDADRVKFITRYGKVIGFSDREAGFLVHVGPAGIARTPTEETPQGWALEMTTESVDGYIRCEAIGRGGRTAWSQPLWADRS